MCQTFHAWRAYYFLSNQPTPDLFPNIPEVNNQSKLVPTPSECNRASTQTSCKINKKSPAFPILFSENVLLAEL